MKSTLCLAVLIAALPSFAAAGDGAFGYDEFLKDFTNGRVVDVIDAELFDKIEPLDLKLVDTWAAPTETMLRIFEGKEEPTIAALPARALYKAVIIDLGRGVGASTVIQPFTDWTSRRTLRNDDAEIVTQMPAGAVVGGVRVGTFALCQVDPDANVNPLGFVRAIYSNPLRTVFSVEVSKGNVRLFKNCKDSFLRPAN
ncbi:MAG: hypothetical protein HY078_09845 [Elusimicrobia bacterium]|nr:hypothetical protein [Elusimicrobiota bacterium]